MIRKGHYHAVSSYTGYRYVSFWITIAAERFIGIPILLGTDAASLDPRSGGEWKVCVKRKFWQLLFCMAKQVIVPSTRARGLICSLRFPS